MPQTPLTKCRADVSLIDELHDHADDYVNRPLIAIYDEFRE